MIWLLCSLLTVHMPLTTTTRTQRPPRVSVCVCAWNKDIVSPPKWLPYMNASMCAVLYCIYVYVSANCIQNICLCSIVQC